MKSDALLAKVKRTIERHSLLAPGDRVLVAVSGGPDSVCLVSVLQSLAQEQNLTLHIAHLDHMFRGKESADDAAFVAKLAQTLDIPATIERIDVPAYCRERGLSSQAGAREARYAFLERTADAVGADRIATGHTASDQAETFLMRLIRGAGVSGLAAIPPVRGSIVRPLIDVTREEVLDYLNEHGTTFVTDSSNAKPLYTRNRVRQELIPALKRFNPRIVETLADEAALLRDEEEAVTSYLESLMETATLRNNDSLSIKRDVFDALPPAFRRRLLRRLVETAGGNASFLSLGRINDALTFLASAQTGKSMPLLHGLSITREYNRFVLDAPKTPLEFSHALAVEGATTIPELGLEVVTAISDTRESGQEDANYLWQARLDCDKIGPLLTLRTRRPGDWLCPSGMGGKRKKLQDFLVDEKIPRLQRDRVPLLCSGDDILWVVGLRTDERFLLGPGTKNVITVTIRPLDGKR